MQINNKQNKSLPGISKLVDAVYTPQLEQFIEKYNSNLDNHTTLMFLAMIFIVLLQLKKNQSLSFTDKKHLVKQIVSEYIRDPEKRTAVINYFSKQNNINITCIDSTPSLMFE